ncbi:unnamed protein product [Victoria cruziana]
MAMSETLVGGAGSEFVQNVVFMRHGDRIDNFEPLWLPNAARPWDPPLIDAGKIRAWCTGKRIRREDFPIHRVFVSPFLRCVQTAAEAVAALCVINDDPAEITSEKAAIDPSRVKVSIEYGLCEIMSREARIEAPPKDGKWFIDISEIETIIPAGSMDHSVEPVYHEPPKWEEDVNAARQRYRDVIIALADKYPLENLLLVSHGEGVGVSVSSFKKGTLVYEVEYCAYSHLRRTIKQIPGREATFGEFQVVTKSGRTGIQFMTQD